MNISDYMQFGNTLKGAYTANQQAIINQQNQQRINDLLANDALRRSVINKKLTSGDQAMSVLGALGQTASPPQPVQPLTTPVGLSQTPPAPAPGQSSQPSPVATPSPVPMPGASMTTAPLPPQQPQAAAPFDPNQIDPKVQSRRDAYALRLMQGELTKQQQALQSATSPQQAQQIQGNIAALRREMDGLSHRIIHNTLSTPTAASGGVAASPTAGTQPDTSMPNDKGVVGKSLALAQNNMPISLLQKFVQKFKTMYPNAKPGQLYLAAQEVNPTLVAQAESASKLAGMTIDSLFKGLTTVADMQRAAASQTNAQTRQAELPSQIQANQARAGYYRAMGNMYGGPSGAGLRNPNFQANLAAWQKYHNGQQPSRYMIGIMQSTPSDQFEKNLVSGQFQFADQKALNKAAQAFTSGPQANQLRSIGVAVNHLDTIKQLSVALKNNDVPAINKFSQQLAQWTGQAAPTNFDAAKAVVGPEIIKAIVQGGGGVSERNKAQELLNRANSPQQLAGAIDTIMKLLRGQVQGFKQQYEAAGLKDFNARFTPEQQKALGLQSSSALSQQDQQALAWADAHPTDPRAAAIKQHLQRQ